MLLASRAQPRRPARQSAVGAYLEPIDHHHEAVLVDMTASRHAAARCVRTSGRPLAWPLTDAAVE